MSVPASHHYRWIEHGSQKELNAECHFDDVALIAAVKEMLPPKAQNASP